MNKISNTITHIAFGDDGNPTAVVGKCTAKDLRSPNFSEPSIPRRSGPVLKENKRDTSVQRQRLVFYEVEELFR